MAYDEKFRMRVIKYKESGHTFAQVYEAFGVTSRSYYVWKAEPETAGRFEKHYPKNRAGKIDTARLPELAEKHKDWYLREFAEEFGVCFQAADKRFKKLGVTRKKNFYLFRGEQRKTRRILSGG